MKTPLNIWDLSIQQSKEKRENLSSKPDSQASERSLLVVGSKEVGKTTLIHRFLESQDSAKPTLALEYTFGRKTNHNLAKVNINLFLHCIKKGHWILYFFWVFQICSYNMRYPLKLDCMVKIEFLSRFLLEKRYCAQICLGNQF